VTFVPDQQPRMGMSPVVRTILFWVLMVVLAAVLWRMAESDERGRAGTGDSISLDGGGPGAASSAECLFPRHDPERIDSRADPTPAKTGRIDRGFDRSGFQLALDGHQSLARHNYRRPLVFQHEPKERKVDAETTGKSGDSHDSDSANE
jgi:hypothetical protein